MSFFGPVKKAARRRLFAFVCFIYQFISAAAL